MLAGPKWLGVDKVSHLQTIDRKPSRGICAHIDTLMNWPSMVFVRSPNLRLAGKPGTKYFQSAMRYAARYHGYYILTYWRGMEPSKIITPPLAHTGFPLEIFISFFAPMLSSKCRVKSARDVSGCFDIMTIFRRILIPDIWRYTYHIISYYKFTVTVKIVSLYRNEP